MVWNDLSKKNLTILGLRSNRLTACNGEVGIPIRSALPREHTSDLLSKDDILAYATIFFQANVLLIQLLRGRR